jgi:hypothetical protein
LSVVDHKFEPMKEVSTMTAQALSHSSGTTGLGTTIGARPASDILIERVALSMLAWSDRRAKKNQFTSDRVARLREVERSAHLGGSPLGR